MFPRGAVVVYTISRNQPVLVSVPEVELQRYLQGRGQCCCFVRVSLDTTRPQSRRLALSALFDRLWTNSIRQDSEPRNHLRDISHIVSQHCFPAEP